MLKLKNKIFLQGLVTTSSYVFLVGRKTCRVSGNKKSNKNMTGKYTSKKVYREIGEKVIRELRESEATRSRRDAIPNRTRRDPEPTRSRTDAIPNRRD